MQDNKGIRQAEPGDILQGRFRVLDVLHKSDRSRILSAYDEGVRDPHKPNECLLKECWGPGVEERCAKEVRILALQEHVSIVRMRSWFSENGMCYIARDYQRGYSLDVVVRETGVQAEDDVRRWMIALCDVMVYLHSPRIGLVYADLKPSNLLLGDDSYITLFDFDAALEGCAGGGCVPVERLGTPGYAAPELVAPGWRVDQRADVYSAGAVMWHLLTGQAPPDCFPLPNVREINPHVCDELAEHLIPLCTKLDAQDRIASFGDLKVELAAMGSLAPEPYGGRRAAISDFQIKNGPTGRDVYDTYPTILLGEYGQGFLFQPIPEPSYTGDVSVGDILVMKEDQFRNVNLPQSCGCGRHFVVERVERRPSSVKSGVFEDAYVCSSSPKSGYCRIYRWMIDFVISGEYGVRYSDEGKLVQLGTQRLKTERLVLRSANMFDVEPMYRNWASDVEVVKYLTWPAYENVEGVKGRIEYLLTNYQRPDFYEWFIEYNEIGEVIGSVGFIEFDPIEEAFEVGYVIGRKWWNHGIATEALSAVLDFAFDKIGAKKMTARCDVENTRSARVLQKCGMRFERTVPQGGKNNRGVVDVCEYSLTR